MSFPLALPSEESLAGAPRSIALSLEKKFSASKASNLEDLSILAACLVAMSREAEARRLLDSVCWVLEYNGNEVVWAAAGDCILLLASLFDQEHCLDERDRLLDKIKAEDVLSSDLPKSHYLEEDLAEHPLVMSQAQSETLKYRLQILAQELMRFIYYQQFWDEIKSDVHYSERDVVEATIKECYSAIKDAIE